MVCYQYLVKSINLRKKLFKEGRTSIANDPHSGRPIVSIDDVHVSQVNNLVRFNRRLTIRNMAEECNISFDSCQGIITEKLLLR